MVTREQITRALGYPRDRLGTYMARSTLILTTCTSEQVRRSHDPGWYEARMAKARAWRLKREAQLALLQSLPRTTIH